MHQFSQYIAFVITIRMNSMHVDGQSVRREVLDLRARGHRDRVADRDEAGSSAREGVHRAAVQPRQGRRGQRLCITSLYFLFTCIATSSRILLLSNSL